VIICFNIKIIFYEVHRKGIILVYFYLGVFKTDTLVVNYFFFHVSVAKNRYKNPSPLEWHIWAAPGLDLGHHPWATRVQLQC
jgi:hypothetical protein